MGKLHDYVLIGGDLNLQDVDWDTRMSKNDLDQPLLDLLESNDMNQIIDFPTAASGILDLILVNYNIEVISCKPANAKINSFTNHKGINLKIRIRNFSNKYLRTNLPISSLSYCRANYEEMNKLIAEKPFNGICWSNVEVLIEQWYDWLKDILARTVPKRRAHCSSLSPWVKPATSNLLRS